MDQAKEIRKGEGLDWQKLENYTYLKRWLDGWAQGVDHQAM